MFLRRSRRQGLNDLLSVKASVFNKYLARMPPANDHASQMNPRDIAFEGVRIERRLATLRIEPHPQAFNEREIGVVARKRKHPPRGQYAFATSIFLPCYFWLAPFSVMVTTVKFPSWPSTRTTRSYSRNSSA